MPHAQTFMGGLQQGYAFVDNVMHRDRQEERQGRLDSLHERQVESGLESAELGRKATRQQMETQAEEREYLKGERAKQEESRKLAGILHSFKSTGNISDEDAAFVDSKLPGGIRNYDDEMHSALRTGVDILGGKQPANSPEGLKAINRIWSDRIKRTVGQPSQGGGKITDVEIIGMVPGKKKGTVAFQLQVTDDKGNVYQAPMTENRSSDAKGDPNVMQVPVEKLVQDFTGRLKIAESMRDETLSALQRAIIERGGSIPKDKLTTVAKDAVVIDDTGREIYNNRSPDGGLSFDDRVKMTRLQRDLTNDAVKILQQNYGGSFEGGMWFPDEENKEVALIAINIAAEKVAAKMNPQQAAREAVLEAEQGIWPAAAHVEKDGFVQIGEKDGKPLIARAPGQQQGQQSGSEPQSEQAMAPSRPGLDSTQPAAPEDTVAALKPMEQIKAEQYAASPQAHRRQIETDMARTKSLRETERLDMMKKFGLGDAQAKPKQVGAKYNLMAQAYSKVQQQINKGVLPEDPQDVALALQFAQGSGQEAMARQLELILERLGATPETLGLE